MSIHNFLYAGASDPELGVSAEKLETLVEVNLKQGEAFICLYLSPANARAIALALAGSLDLYLYTPAEVRERVLQIVEEGGQ